MVKYLISTPPSANSLFYNAKMGGRRKTRQYQAWIRGTLKELLAQRAKPFEGRANVTIMVPKSRGDIDNKVKPAIDLLVRAGVLQNDSPKFVSGISVSFGDEQLMVVEITAA